MPKYVTSAQARKVFNVSSFTLRNWANTGSINARAITNVSGRKTWLYDLESIGTLVGQEDNTSQPDRHDNQANATVIYCRVSSNKQLPDLDRQKALLSSAFPDCEVITDVGSGINYNKPGLTKLVEMVCREQIGRIVVTFKDRLLRFGFELFEKMCKEHKVQIVVYSDEHRDEQELKDMETQELQEDLLSIVNVFVARRNGKKGGVLKRLRKEQTAAQQLDQNQAIPDDTAEDTIA
jgi:predicted site-specific integrase-resolvase